MGFMEGKRHMEAIAIEYPAQLDVALGRPKSSKERKCPVNTGMIERRSETLKYLMSGPRKTSSY